MNSKLLICLAILAFALPAVAQQKAKQPIFSLDFDDGYQSAFEHALPILDAAHMKATWFIITTKLGTPEYMTRDEVVALDKDGQEIGSHSESHPNLSDLAMKQQTDEIAGSRDYLNGLLGHAPLSFAYPYGARNDGTVAAIQQAGYTTARTIDWGSNGAGITNPFQLAAYCVDDTTKFDDVKELIDNAPSGSWVIIVFHRFDRVGNPISVDPQLLQDTVDYLAKKNASVVTETQGWKVFHEQ